MLAVWACRRNREPALLGVCFIRRTAGPPRRGPADCRAVWKGSLVVFNGGMMNPSSENVGTQIATFIQSAAHWRRRNRSMATASISRPLGSGTAVTVMLAKPDAVPIALLPPLKECTTAPY